MRNPQSCVRRGCSHPAATTLRAEALCLDHFCIRCYEILDAIESRRRPDSSHTAPNAAELLVAEECARRVLDISMTSKVLNNLERARLLDILLWSSDVVSPVHPKNVTAKSASARQPYEKPGFVERWKNALRF